MKAPESGEFRLEKTKYNPKGDDGAGSIETHRKQLVLLRGHILSRPEDGDLPQRERHPVGVPFRTAKLASDQKL
jgi:hypothetical protein